MADIEHEGDPGDGADLHAAKRDRRTGRQAADRAFEEYHGSDRAAEQLGTAEEQHRSDRQRDAAEDETADQRRRAIPQAHAGDTARASDGLRRMKSRTCRTSQVSRSARGAPW